MQEKRLFPPLLCGEKNLMHIISIQIQDDCVRLSFPQLKLLLSLVMYKQPWKVREAHFICQMERSTCDEACRG